MMRGTIQVVIMMRHKYKVGSRDAGHRAMPYAFISTSCTSCFSDTTGELDSWPSRNP